MYTTIRILRRIIYAAAERGGNIRQLCAAAGIQERDLQNADKRVYGAASIINLWEEALRATKDSCFGLHIGESYNPSLLGVLGFFIQSCPRLKDAYQAMQKNQELISGWISYGIELQKDQCELVFHVHPAWRQASAETARQGIAMTMSGSLTTNRIMTERVLKPIRAELNFSQVSMRHEYERVFQCPVAFNQDKNRLLFERQVAETPLLSHNESLYLYFARVLEEKNKEVGEVPTFIKTVKQVIIQDFQGQVPALEIIAAHLNLSRRTFQRKLQAENASYRSLAMQLKKELAISLLKNSDARVAEISEVLGYAESSAFQRAFRNWTNTTPGKSK